MKLLDYIDNEIQQEKCFITAYGSNSIKVSNCLGYIKALELLRENIDNGYIEI